MALIKKPTREKASGNSTDILRVPFSESKANLGSCFYHSLMKGFVKVVAFVVKVVTFVVKVGLLCVWKK